MKVSWLLLRRIPGITARCIGLAVTVFALCSQAQTNVVSPGYDLWATRDGTQFNFIGTPLSYLGTQPFEGVPLETYDFGGAIGVQATADIDTIVRRIDPATDNGDEIDIEMVALSLRSVNSVDLTPVGGLNEHMQVVNLQDMGSTMTINFVDSLYSARLELQFELEGEISGFNTGSILKTFEINGQAWDRDVDPSIVDPVLINGVNSFLNGVDSSEDFFPQGLAIHDAGNDTVHVATATGVPEPTTLALLGLGSLALVMARRQR